MPNNNKKPSDIGDKISISTYGIGEKMDKESKVLSDIVKQVSIETDRRFGKGNSGDDIIDTLTQTSLSNLFSYSTDKKTKKQTSIMDRDDFKQLMIEENQSAVSLLSAEGNRLINYSNYFSIKENIPECALAEKTYTNTIMCPDDYSNTSLILRYNISDNTADKENIDQKLRDLSKKYNLEQKLKEYVSDTVTFGDCFVSVLPYDEEISKMLVANGQTSLNESLLQEQDPVLFDHLNEAYRLDSRLSEDKCSTLTEDLDFVNTEEKEVLEEEFGTDFSNSFTKFINTGVKVRSVTDLLKSKAEADNDIIFNKDIVYGYGEKEKLNNKKKTKINRMNINGAVIKKLSPERTVKLEIGDVCYGYYYIEPGVDGFDSNVGASMVSTSAIPTSSPMNPTITQPKFGVDQNPANSSSAAKNLGVSDQKINILSGVILKAIGKKLNKKYIEENKQFKDLLYSLLKQKEILEKGISITFFMPDEVVHFHNESIFSKIVFFAKIYLATLTSIVLIKMGRGNDTRLITVKPGIDNNYEQTITKVIQDMKTKEFKMSNLGSISSVLNLNPGAFNDIIVPEDASGQTPVHFETMQGMNQDINNEFMNFLKESMILGTGLPPAISEANNNIEFAKQIAAQNTNFCRTIISWQQLLKDPAQLLVRLLFKYEYKYSIDAADFLDSVDISKIEFEFPSPGTLKMSNLIEQFTQVDSIAESIAKIYIPDKMDQSSVDKQAAFKGEIIKNKLLPQLEWTEYSKLFDKFELEYSKSKIKEKAKKKRQPDDMNSDGGMY